MDGGRLVRGVARLFAEVFGEDVFGFTKPDAMQRTTLDMRLQLLPKKHGQHLRRGLHVLWNEINVEVQVGMVHLVNDGTVDNPAQQLDIHDEASHGVGDAFHGDEKLVIVAMPVAVGTFAKGGEVLFLAPALHP